MTPSIDILITIIGGILAFCKWVYEYSKKNRWDKDKYLVECIKDFNSNDAVKCCEKMLDWNAVKFQYRGIIIKTDDEEVFSALLTHNIKTEFKPQEVLIRELFDSYFDELTKLIIICNCNLISEKNLIKFMGYWISILNGEKNNKPKIFIDQINQYLKYYGYTELLTFLNKHKK